MQAIGGRTPGTMIEGTHAGVADHEDADDDAVDHAVDGCRGTLFSVNRSPPYSASGPRQWAGPAALS